VSDNGECLTCREKVPGYGKRGCCAACYQRHMLAVRSGAESWDGLIAAGLAAKSRRGFAGMTAEAVHRIASQGGKAAHAAGTAHEFTAEEAKAAGRLGGLAAQRRKRVAG
jgi:hypothetical protein